MNPVTVKLRYKSSIPLSTILGMINGDLAKTIATSLKCDDWSDPSIKADDIEFELGEIEQERLFSSFDLKVEIEAKSSPTMRATMDRRCAAITVAVSKLIQPARWRVAVQLKLVEMHCLEL